VFSLQEILETITMIREENLDIRTITLGINIRDCCHPDPAVAQRRIYDKITSLARDLVRVGEDIAEEYGIPSSTSGSPSPPLPWWPKPATPMITWTSPGSWTGRRQR